MIKGNGFKPSVKFDIKLKLQRKSGECSRPDNPIKSRPVVKELQLDTLLARVNENSPWDKELIDEVIKYAELRKSVLSVCQG